MTGNDRTSGRLTGILVLAALAVFAAGLLVLSDRAHPPHLGEPVVVTTPSTSAGQGRPARTSETRTPDPGPTTDPTSLKGRSVATPFTARTDPVPATKAPAKPSVTTRAPDTTRVVATDPPRSTPEPGSAAAPQPTTTPGCDDDCGSDDD